MALIESLLSAETAFGFALAIGLWAFGKVLDKILEVLIGTKVIRPLIGKVKLKFRSFLTIIDPVEATFQINYSPRDEYSVAEIKNRLEDVFDTTERESKQRVKAEKIRWTGKDGKTEVKHTEAKYPYTVSLDLVRDSEDRAENPEKPVEEQLIEGINFQIKFRFPFPALEAEIPNLGIFASKLEDGLDEVFYGIASDAQIVIHPIESELTLDEWINREGFDVSLLLAGSNDGVTRTEVEFFPDHVEVHPPYYEVDSEVIRYIRLLVMNYYLEKKTASNVLGLKRN